MLLQAENEADRMDWIDKIRGVIASLLNSPFLEQVDHLPFSLFAMDAPDCLLVNSNYLSSYHQEFCVDGSFMLDMRMDTSLALRTVPAVIFH